MYQPPHQLSRFICPRLANNQNQTMVKICRPTWHPDFSQICQEICVAPITHRPIIAQNFEAFILLYEVQNGRELNKTRHNFRKISITLQVVSVISRIAHILLSLWCASNYAKPQLPGVLVALLWR